MYFRDELVGDVDSKERKWHAEPYEECPGGVTERAVHPHRLAVSA